MSLLKSGNTKSCGCLVKENSFKQQYVFKGAANGKWKGGKTHHDGYVRVIDKAHPRSNHDGYVYEHILVMEKMLGRTLVKGEVIHHCNGNKLDNRPYNLRLFPSNSEHTKYHFKLKAQNYRSADSRSGVKALLNPMKEVCDNT